MKSMMLSVAALAGLAAPGAFAQSPPSVPADGPPALPGNQAVVGGKDIQPQGAPDQKLTGSLAGVERVLQQDDPYGDKPGQVVQPRDLYGNPMGGDPGMEIPAVKPIPPMTPATAP